jgi:hypothetical protein
MDQNVPSWLKFLLEWEPRTLISQNGPFFFVTLHSRFTGFRLLPLNPMVNYEYFTGCPCILGNSQWDYHFVCKLLTGYLKLKDSCSNDLLPLSEGFLNGPVLPVLWQTAGTRDLTAIHSRYPDVYGWLGNACNWGLAIILPDKQLYQQCLATVLMYPTLLTPYTYSVVVAMTNSSCQIK